MQKKHVIAMLGLGLATLPGAALAQGSLVMGMVLEPPHLDPTAGAAAAIDEVVYANVFEGLTRIDRQGVPQPALAKSWDVSSDGLTHTYTLNEGVTFHDGSAFDCEDVKFSMERAKAPDSVNAQKGLFEPIESITCEGPLTAVFKLKQPVANFAFNLGWGDAVIVAAETADANKNNPVGTGPFKFSRWVQGDRVELARNADYWGEPATLDSATFKFVADPAAATAAMLAGDIDAFANFPAPESMPQFEANPELTVHVGTTEGETIMGLNNAKAPFDDVRVRQAIMHAIDRNAVIDGAMFGYGTPIGSHFAPHHPAYVDLTEKYPYDPEKARALLAEAGHPDGIKATLKLPPPSYARRSGEIIAAMLADVGVQVELVPMEWAQWLEQVFKQGDFDMTIVSHTEPMDIGIYARDKYYFNYDNDAFKDMYSEYETTLDQAKSRELLGAMQRRIADDSVNAFLFQLPKQGVWRKDVEGLWENSPIQANDLTDVRRTQ